MKRVLVIKDVGLWISLNRYLAGGTPVRLSEAATVESGVRLARIEMPDLVVCSTESAERDAGALESRLGEIPRRVPIVCVDKDAPEGVPAPARFAVCRPDCFLPTVAQVIGEEKSCGVGPRVDLLAHFEMHGPAQGETRRGFANLIELGEAEALMTSDEPLEVGDQLALTFFVPPAGSPSGARQKIALSCEVKSCRDAEKLLYVAGIRAEDDDSARALRRYVAQAEQAPEPQP